ncbi:MAG: peptidoglycan/LPS O-acetylase OafA/YrhL [Luteibaculaceae bacterium]|jgi:peptidoglycan/LPS O-acetylase OafA/YrhL
MKAGYIPGLHGFRFFCAFLIIVTHSISGNNDLGVFIEIPLGMVGVSFFFVLSGFLITRGLLNSTTSGASIIRFFKNRALRIFPLYYIGLIYYVIFYWLEGLGNPLALVDSWYYWIYLQNIADTFSWEKVGPSHYWSLAVEEHFYLFWPFIVLFCARKRLKTAIWGLVVLASITRLYLLWIGAKPYYFTFSRLDDLCFGALFALACNNGMSTTLFFRYRYVIGAVLAFFGAILFFIGDSGEMVFQFFKYPVVSLIGLVLVQEIIIRKDSRMVQNVLEFKWIKYGGEISYGLYVYNLLAGLIIQNYFPVLENRVLVFVVIFAGTYLVSAVSFEFIEKPFLKLKKAI